MNKLNIWAIVGVTIIILAIAGFIAYFVKSCNRPMNEADAIALVDSTIKEIGREQFIKDNNIKVILVRGDTATSSLVTKGDLYLNLHQTKSNMRDSLIFELGHFVFEDEWCDAMSEKGLKLVCHTYIVTPKSMRLRHCIQSHIFANMFRENKGQIVVDDQFLNEIQFYNETDSKYEEMLKVCSEW